MFVTCLYLVLEPTTGEVVYANAGHNLPYVRTDDGVRRTARATGMPLGLLPGMTYEETDGRHRPAAERPALQRRPDRGPRPGRRDVRLPATAGSRWRASGPVAS